MKEPTGSFFEEFVEFALANADPDVDRKGLACHLDSLRKSNDEGKLVILTSTDTENKLNGVLAFLLVPPMAGFASWKELQEEAVPFSRSHETNIIEDIISEIFNARPMEVLGLAVAMFLTTAESRKKGEAFTNLLGTLNGLLENRYFIPVVYTTQTFGSSTASAFNEAMGFQLTTELDDPVYAATPDNLIKKCF